MQVRIADVAAVLALSTAAFAQGAAPRETASATIDGKKVAIEYGRPSLKGRTFDALSKDLPADRMWRAGSEQVTTLTTETDIVIGGKKVPAGKYSLYVHAPENGDYSLAINSDLGVPLGKIWAQAPANLAKEPWPHMQDYQKNIGAKEVARATMTKGTVTAPAEMFTVKLTPAPFGAVMTLSWGDKSWALDVKSPKER